MNGPVNVIRTRTGKLRPVCEFCGKIGRAVEPDDRGRIHLWDLARGWSVAPYPPDVEHDDGTRGDLFECPDCRRRMEREGSLTPHPDRMAARRARRAQQQAARVWALILARRDDSDDAEAVAAVDALAATVAAGREPTVDELHRVAAALGVQLSDLVRDAEGGSVND